MSISRHLPIISTKPSELDLSEFPNLAAAQEKGNFSRDTIDALCRYGMHYIPESRPNDEVLKFIDGLARRNSHLESQTKVRKKGLNLGQVLAKSLNPKASENLNGVKSLLLTNIFLAEMKNQGLIKNFYHCDQPLLNEINDEHFLDHKAAGFLDNCGADILVEIRDGEFVPIQIKSSSPMKSRTNVLIPNEDFKEIDKHYAEKEFKTKSNHKGDQTRVYIKRSMPTFTTDIRYKDNWQNLFGRFKSFIGDISKTNHALSLETDLSNKPRFELVRELVDNKYIEILSPEEYESKRSAQSPKKSLDAPSDADIRVEKQETQAQAQAQLDQIYYNQFENLDDPKKLQSFLSQKAHLWAGDPKGTATTILDKTLKKFFNKKVNHAVSILKDDEANWIKLLTTKNKLGPAMMKRVKEIETANPKSGYNVYNFIQLKQDLTIALLKDHFKEANQVSEKNLRKRFNSNDYDSIWNPHNQPIQRLIKLFQELELNRIELDKEKIAPLTLTGKTRQQIKALINLFKKSIGF